jgi:DNA ligase-1
MSTLKLFNDVLVATRATSSKSQKQNIIAVALDQHPELGHLFELALSPYITFGIAKFPPGDPIHCLLLTDEAPAFQVLRSLSIRDLTGRDAIAAVWAVRAALSVDQCDAFDCILLKDLKAGFGESTVNKAKPGTVSVFSCQLAMSEMPKLSTLSYPIIAEPKYDGVRCIAIRGTGTVQLFSRNGKQFDNFAEIEAVLTDRMLYHTVLDGEILSSAGFQALMTRAKAKRGVHDDVPIHYQVFDGMPYGDWEGQKCTMTLFARYRLFHPCISAISSDLVRETPSLSCHSSAEIEAYYAEQLALGFEGLMLKSPSGLYTFKRNKTWMKLKPFETIDLQVTAFREGTGKYKGMLGSLVCEGIHDGKHIMTEVGSGFTDAQRLDWALGLHGVVEVRFQEMTLAEGSDTWSLRFPTFVRGRGAEKI